MEKSAITDHLEIDWEGARVVEREIDWRMHKSKKAIQIRLQGVDYEPGPGGGVLSGIYDPLFTDLCKVGGNDRGTELQVRRRHKDSSFEQSIEVDETIGN